MSAARKELTMGTNMEGLEPRVARIETNILHLVAQNAEIKADLRALTTKLDEKFDKIDEKFAKVDEKFTRIEEKFDERFTRVDEKFAKVDEKFAKVDEKFVRVDEKFSALLEKLGELKVWAIIVIGGGVLSVVARAFHWI